MSSLLLSYAQPSGPLAAWKDCCRVLPPGCRAACHPTHINCGAGCSQGGQGQAELWPVALFLQHTLISCPLCAGPGVQRCAVQPPSSSLGSWGRGAQVRHASSNAVRPRRNSRGPSLRATVAGSVRGNVLAHAARMPAIYLLIFILCSYFFITVCIHHFCILVYYVMDVLPCPKPCYS